MPSIHNIVQEIIRLDGSAHLEIEVITPPWLLSNEFFYDSNTNAHVLAAQIRFLDWLHSYSAYRFAKARFNTHEARKEAGHISQKFSRILECLKAERLSILTTRAMLSESCLTITSCGSERQQATVAGNSLEAESDDFTGLKRRRVD